MLINMYMHWFGPFFGDREPNQREYILHDDSQPLDEDGCVSNAIHHLRLGTASENMKECNAIHHLRLGTASENMKECNAIGALSKKRKISNE